MKYFLFSDSEVWHREIKANTFTGALRKAKEEFGIKVPLRCVSVSGEFREYRASLTNYKCTLHRID